MLLALTITLGAQILRVLFPLVYRLGERTSFLLAGTGALVTFLAPLATPLVVRVLGRRSPTLVAVGGLAALRVVVQMLRPVPLWAAAVATALALIAATLLLHAARARGRSARADFLVGMLLGLSLDAALKGAFSTWDHAWQDGPIPLLVTLATAAGALLCAKSADAEPAPLDGGRESVAGVLLGPVLMLELVFLQSPAFVASASQVSLAAATFIVLLAGAVSVGAASVEALRPLSSRSAGLLGAAAVACAWAAIVAEGLIAAAAVVVCHCVVAALAMRIVLIEGRGGRRPSLWRTSGAAATGSFVFALLVFVYQIHFDMPLPFSNMLLFPGAAALVAVAALSGHAATAGARSALWAGAAIICMLIVPAVLWLTAPPLGVAPPSGSIRIVSYNIHSAVDGNGQVDPEAIARVIAGQRPDVVVLQELNRGLPIGGMTDLGEWLSRRLAMPYVYAPASHVQFGNALMSRIPIRRSSVGLLPKGAGPQTRSYVRGRLALGDGEFVDVIGTHLQHRKENTPTRLLQLRVLLDKWDGAPRTVVAGDMNSEPGSPEIRRLQDAGLERAGDSPAPTWPSRRPRVRLDYIFGTPDVRFSDFAILRSTASDHLPLVVTATLP